MLMRLLQSAALSSLTLNVWNTPLLAQRVKPTSPPDAVYVHGNIVTGEGLTSDAPKRVAALAIQNGIIVATGDDAAILKLRGPKTEVVDLRGAFAMPGFNDAHVHLASAGRTKLTIDLVGVKSLSEMQKRIAAAAKNCSSGCMAAWTRLGSHAMGVQTASHATKP